MVIDKKSAKGGAGVPRFHTNRAALLWQNGLPRERDVLLRQRQNQTCSRPLIRAGSHVETTTQWLHPFSNATEAELCQRLVGSQRSGYRRRAEAPSFIAYPKGQGLSVTGQGNGGPVGVSLFGNIHQQFPSALEE